MLDAAIEEFTAEVRASGGVIECTRADGLLVFLVVTPENIKSTLASPLLIFGFRLAKASEQPDSYALFRAVKISRLQQVITSGCDVTPSDSVLFANMSPEKSLEYGEFPKVVQVFNGKHLERSWRTVPASVSEDELHQLLQTYKTKLVAQDESHLWLSRLPPGHTAVGTPYEQEHAYWIPGDPFLALMAVVVIARDLTELSRVVELFSTKPEGPKATGSI